MIFPFVFQAPPKQVPKTIESMRVYDETMVAPEDEEVGIKSITKSHWQTVATVNMYILLW